MLGKSLIDNKVKNRIYCVLFAALLAAGKVFAEDDIVEIDPNGYTVSGFLSSLWNLLAGLVG